MFYWTWMLSENKCETFFIPTNEQKKLPTERAKVLHDYSPETAYTHFIY